MTPVLLCLTLIAANSEQGSSWNSFRNGGSSRSSAAQLPVKWSPNKGIAWQRELAGYGQSAPVVWNGSVYVTSVQGPMKEKCAVTALDLGTGKVRWMKAFQSSAQAPSNYRVSRAAPTPVVDKSGVYAFFETGDFISLSHQGKLLWKRSLTKEYGAFLNHHGLASSPSHSTEALFLNVEHHGSSYLLAIDKANGKNKWKVKRKSGMSWSSPIVLGGKQIIVSSNGTVTSYDTENGKTNWALGNLGGNSKVSPTASGQCLFVAAEISEFGTEQAAARSNLCVDLKSINENGPNVLWRARRAVCHYASPVVHRGCVYYVNKQGIVHCLDQKTGKAHYVKRLQLPCWATPVAAGDHVYFFGTNGTGKVIKSGRVFQLVATNHLWNPDTPPRPERYVEAEVKRKPGRGSSGPFVPLMKNDSNGDQKLTPNELPEQIRGILSRVDLNKDGALDMSELKEMEKRFRQKRTGSRTSTRDPIVYGVAAVERAILIRTGTRLYCVGSPIKR